jgi:hypothetical protein
MLHARTRRSRYRDGVSLRRFRHRLECRRSGHDVRPYIVDGSRVVQRCLRCGAIVDQATRGVVATPRPEPQPSNLPPAPAERLPAPQDGAADGAEAGDAPTLAALSALRELGELHTAGVITDDEFAHKKAELLRRV